jgi:tetratricopeptide (TPR) repeat protein
MSDRIKLIILSILLLAGILITYSNHWHNEFHFDDTHTVQNNVYIQQISNIPLFYKDPKTFSNLPTHCSYRPLVSTTLAIDYYLGHGLNPFYFHLDTFILFLLQGVLMFFMFAKILESACARPVNQYAALFATALYMLHPALAETVNYVISRSDTLSTLFVVMAFVVYQYSAVARKYYLYLIPVLIGSLAKPTAVMFAPMLLVYHILFEQKKFFFDLFKFDWKKILFVAIPSFILAASVYLYIKHKEEGLFEAGGYSFFNYVITQPFVLVHYVSQFLLPTKLSADTDWGTFASAMDPKALIGFVFVFCLFFATVYLSRFERWRPVSFGLAWFILSLVPTSFVPLAEVMNDHRIFYPYVGLSIALVWTCYLLFEKTIKQVSAVGLMVFLMVLLCGYAYGTHQRNEVWRNEETLWHDVSIKSPKNGRGLMNYGLIFMSRSSYDTADYYFTKAYEYYPKYSLLHINMAILKDAMGNKVDAENHFISGIAISPGEAGNYYYYARFLKQQGRKDEAIANLYKCLNLVDSRMEARYDLMPLLYEQKRMEELKTVAQRTLQLSPDDANATTYLQMASTGKSLLEIEIEKSANYKTPGEFLNLSLMYYNAGNYQGCIDAAEKAIKLKPDYAEAYNNIGSAYNAMNKFEEGVKACEAALKINPNYALAQGNLNYAKSKLKK